MYGVIKPDELYYCQQDRTTQLNDRIYARNVPNFNPQMLFSPRPVPTKYDLMPIVDRRAVATVPIKVQPTYNINKDFMPTGDQGGCSGMGPWSGFADRVNDESRLNNQFFALSKCEQGNYVPSSTSDLYQVHISGKPDIQSHPLLFVNPNDRLRTNSKTCLPPALKVFNNNTDIKSYQFQKPANVINNQPENRAELAASS
jgi:hypothetical protein